LAKVLREREVTQLPGACIELPGMPDPEPSYVYSDVVVVPDDWTYPASVEEALEWTSIG